MTEIEKAIAFLNDIKAALSYTSEIKSRDRTIINLSVDRWEELTTSIIALKEQAERSKGCKGCTEQGKWDSELEYGYPCPCLMCCRNCSDNYKLTKEGADEIRRTRQRSDKNL